MADNARVLVVGTGAIGSFYGAILSRAGARVDVVSRSEHAQMQEHGVRVDSKELGDLSFRPATVYKDVTEVSTPPDFLVLSVKVLDDLDRAALIRPAVGPDTAIVLIENGIEIEPPIVEAFPDNPLVSCLAFVAASRVGPAHTEHKAYGRLVIGSYPSGVNDAARRFSALLEQGGINAPLSENLVTERWRKAVWNAAFNPVSVIAGGASTKDILGSENEERLLVALMQEVCDVAAAAGHPMPEDLPEKSIVNTHKMPAYHNSMALDYIHGRDMEIEAILGNVIREARRLNIPVPHLETVYGTTKMLQRRIAAKNAEATS
ncbi:MAG: 2-dehydropantoate 2-reductase [Ectothiorhodospiraceae bacterium]|nr:2-dehydropantoate 2-reductase [Ectothiorhodospiraceae bacterium]